MSDELTRERAYARLVVAIVGDPYARNEERSRAIDAIVDRMVDRHPCEETWPNPCDCQPWARASSAHVMVCAGVVDPFTYCAACAVTP